MYRYEICTEDCAASLELPNYFPFLNENTQVWVNPKNHLGSAYGIVNDNQSCINFTSNCDGMYDVLIIGTRCDRDAMHRWNGVERYKTPTSDT